MIRSSPRGRGKAASRVIPNLGTEGTETERRSYVWGNLKSFNTVNVKFTVGLGEQDLETSQVRALYLPFLEVWLPIGGSVGKIPLPNRI